MANTVIQLKKSGTPSATPATLANGELAINYADGKLFYKDTLGNIQEISGGGGGPFFGSINVAGTLVVPDIPGDILTINSGNNIELTPDTINDSYTITANLKPAFDVANAAFNSANNVAPQVTPAFNVANAAFAKANAALANTSGVSFAGNLFFPTGNVGIGTSSPSSKLQVNGTITIANTGPVETFRSGANTITLNMYDEANGTLSWEGSAGQLFSITNDLSGSLFTVNDVSGIPSIEVDALGNVDLAPFGGNVGIGTSNPVYKLDVQGDARITGNLTLGDATTDTITVNAANFNLANNVSFDSGTLFIDAQNNRVGVGITNPQHSLSVNGSIHLTTGDGDRIWSGSNNLRLGSYPELAVSDTLRISGGQQSIVFGGTGAYATIGSNVPWDFVKGTTPQGIRIHGTFTNVSNYERLNISVNSTAAYIQTENAGTGVARPLYLGANNATAVTIDTAGRVGIGTTSPAEKLHITGNARFGPLGNQLQIGVSAFQAGVWSLYTLDANHLSLGTNNLERLRIDASGNLGIGTSSPAYTLDVNGTVESYGSLSTLYSPTGSISPFATPTALRGLRLQNTDNTTNTAVGIDFVAGSSSTATSYIVGIREGSFLGALAFGTRTNVSGDYAEAMRITSAGRVGIGTASPAYKLDVNGSVKLANTSFLYWGNYDGTTVGPFIRSNGNDSLYLESGPNGPGRGVISLKGYNNSQFETAFGVLSLKASQVGSGYITLDTAGSERLRITSVGDIGVGTSSPETYKSGNAANSRALIVKGACNNNTEYGSITLVGYAGGGAVAGSVDFFAHGYNIVSAIRPIMVGGGNSADLGFYTASGGVLTKNMYLTSSGKLITNQITAYDNFYAAEGTPLILSNYSTGVGTNIKLKFQGSDGSGGTPESGYIKSIRTAITSSTVTCDLSFAVTNNSNTSYEVVRFKSDGNVGIGTSAPSSTLHVIGTANITSSVTASDYNSSTTGYKISGTQVLYYSGGVTYLNDLGGGIGLRTASTTRLFIDTSGNVGINTSSPKALLDVKPLSTSNTFSMVISSGQTVNGFGSLRYTTSYAHNDLLLGNFQDAAGYSQTAISFGYTGDPARKLHIGSANSSTFDSNASFVPAVTVTSGGRLGVGTTSPATTLHVIGTANVSSTIYTRDIEAPFYSLYNEGAGAYVGIKGNYLRFGGVSEFMRIANTSGYVGIGTTAPAYRLDVTPTNNEVGLHLAPTTGYDTGFYITSHANNDTVIGSGAAYVSAQFVAKASSAEIINLYNGGYYFYGDTGLTPGSVYSPTMRMVLDSNGNFLLNKKYVGGESQAALTVLHSNVAHQGISYDVAVFQSDDAPGLRIVETNTVGNFNRTAELTLCAGDGYANNFAPASVIGSNAALIFATGRAIGSYAYATTGERMRITSAGNVGIGTTSPSAKLDVAGSFNVTGQSYFKVTSGVSNHTVSISSNDSQGAAYLLRFLDNSGNFLSGIDGSGNGTFPGSRTISFSDGSIGNTLSIISGNPGGLGIQSSTSISIATGGTSEKVRITSAGNVGIGTSSPSANLHVVGSVLIYPNSLNATSRLRTRSVHADGRWAIDMNANGTDAKLAQIYSGTIGLGTGSFSSGALDTAIGFADDFAYIPKLRIGGINSGPANISYISITANNTSEWNYGNSYPDGNNYYQIRTSLESGGGAQRAPLLIGAKYLYFATGATDNERMRIDANGNVGIGTTAPQTLLDVAGSDNNGIQYRTATRWISIGSSGGLSTVASGSGTEMVFSVGSERMRINANGNVGIGTTSPGGKLTVAQPSGTYTSGAPFFSSLYDNTQHFNIYMDGNWNTHLSSIQVSTNQSALAFDTNGSERMRITSTGNVGIGTSSPTAVLDLHHVLNESRTFLGFGVAGGPGNIATFSYNNADTSFRINLLNRPLIIRGGGDGTVEMVRFTSTGNVGIGTTAPAEKLEVNGNIKANSYIMVNSAMAPITVITATTTDQIIDSFTTSTWRSAQYNITMTAGTDYHTTQISLIHDGTNAYITEYGTLSTANNLGTFSATVSGSTVRLNVVPTFANTSINMLRTTNK